MKPDLTVIADAAGTLWLLDPARGAVEIKSERDLSQQDYLRSLTPSLDAVSRIAGPMVEPIKYSTCSACSGSGEYVGPCVYDRRDYDEDTPGGSYPSRVHHDGAHVGYFEYVADGRASCPTCDGYGIDWFWSGEQVRLDAILGEEAA